MAKTVSEGMRSGKTLMSRLVEGDMAILDTPEKCISLFKYVANNLDCHDESLFNIAIRNIETYANEQKKYEWKNFQTDPEPYNRPRIDGVYEVLLVDKEGELYLAKATWSNKVLPSGNRKGFGFRDFYNIDFTKHVIVAWRETSIT